MPDVGLPNTRANDGEQRRLRPPMHADDHRLTQLREEIGRLVNDLPGRLSNVSARIDDVSVEVSWAEVSEPAAPAGRIAQQDSTPINNETDDSYAVTAPLVGTFYQAPEPNAQPFVEIGDQVSAGQTVAIIESMKLMNPITAEHAGVVSEICVKDGAGVEFGQPLFKITSASTSQEEP